MPKNSISFLVLIIITFSVGLGCGYFQFSRSESPQQPEDLPKESAPTRTTLTREFLIERLRNKGVELVPPQNPEMKPNPLVLFVKFVRSGPSPRLSLNSPDNQYEFDDLVRTLKEIFKDREAKGVFKEGTSEVAKEVFLGFESSETESYKLKNLSVEDYERLVDNLKKEGIDDIKLAIDYFPMPPHPEKDPSSKKTVIGMDDDVPPPPVKTPSPGTTPPLPKVISGGVLNGKATNLVKPLYPPAAKAARASGTVTVQVTIDENGNVISAAAVAGHVLLRAPAEAAARASKFSPTMLSGQKVRVTGVVIFNFIPPE